MSICNDCQRRTNGSCYLMGDHPDCGDFVPAQKKEHQKPDSSRYRNGVYRVYRNAPIVTKKQDIGKAESPGAKHPRRNEKVDVGQRLYFRNKYTGGIEYGVITEKREKSFYFRFAAQEKRFPYTVIGERLFLTETAVKYFSDK